MPSVLSCAVASDDADDFTLFDFERDVFERPDDVPLLARITVARNDRLQTLHDLVAQGVIAELRSADLVSFGEILYSDSFITHVNLTAGASYNVSRQAL
jgi:hypothetical protein